ncbi:MULTISPECIES: hypothetical protein [Giesbergeria]|uniref:Glycosyltransferase 2-like domain-containing protein n=1 Tax=Giesbergeria sinuosa TaxID=80883 RepID=A0ABV9QCR6_9BURK
MALRHQTIKPEKIIFSDDSPNQDFFNFLSQEPIRTLVADLNVQVVHGPRKGAWNNFRNLIDIYCQQGENKTEFFHILLDDDIIYPRFYERHLEAHRLGHLSCVVSRRWTALESGQPISDNLPVPEAVANYPYSMIMLNSAILFLHTVGNNTNWLGEFSNVTFRASVAEEIIESQMAGISYAGLEDLGAFLKSSLHAPVGYVKEFLGAFRTSAQQHSADPMGKPLKSAFLAYIALAIAARNIGQLTKDQSAQAILKVAAFILQHYSEEKDMQEFCRVMHEFLASSAIAERDFLAVWSDFSKSVW